MGAAATGRKLEARRAPKSDSHGAWPKSSAKTMVWCASASANCASRAKERDSTEEEEAADRSLSALERCGGSSASSAAGRSALQSTFRRAEGPPPASSPAAEPERSQAAVRSAGALIERVLGCGELLEPEVDLAEFTKQLKAALAQAPPVYNPLTRKMAPWVDVNALHKHFKRVANGGKSGGCIVA